MQIGQQYNCLFFVNSLKPVTTFKGYQLVATNRLGDDWTFERRCLSIVEWRASCRQPRWMVSTHTNAYMHNRATKWVKGGETTRLRPSHGDVSNISTWCPFHTARRTIFKEHINSSDYLYNNIKTRHLNICTVDCRWFNTTVEISIRWAILNLHSRYIWIQEE